MSDLWPQAIEGRIATKNKMGFMFTEIHGVSSTFIQDSKTFQGTVVDVGCAYGIVTLAILAASNCRVVASDLSQEHLEILRNSTRQAYLNKLELIQGQFPKDFNFAENSLDAIHSSFMFHFLSGDDTHEGLNKCFQALKPGGKLYINTISVYLTALKGVISLYEENLAKHVKWPGEIYNLEKYIPEQDIPHAPTLLHVHDKPNFEKLLQNAGFNIHQSFYYDIKEPAWFASDGKGFIGVIATKPT